MPGVVSVMNFVESERSGWPLMAFGTIRKELGSVR